jgi:hypothetical protein
MKKSTRRLNLFQPRDTNGHGLVARRGIVMFKIAVTGATLVAGLVLSVAASAKAPAPLVPIALVEDITSATADVEFMDYVGTGQVIKLAPKDTMVLSYLKSCQHETITGGIVKVGADRSEVQGGSIKRAKVPCSGGKMQLASAEANASGASSFRLQSAPINPLLYSVTPMVQLPRLAASDPRVLIIERMDKPGTERAEIAIDEKNPGFVDLAKTDTKPLSRGGVYRATVGPNKVVFKIDAKAKTKGKVPVVSRLLRFPPG